MKISKKTVSVVDTNELICSLFGMEIAGGELFEKYSLTQS